MIDVIIIGAGAAGMMCAMQAGARGKSVLLLDHGKKLGAKILISGGGRCNFTNLGASAAQYVSRNPHFCKSALSRYPSSEFIALIKKHEIAYHERKHGQLFCDHSAADIVALLRAECEAVGARILLDCKVLKVERSKEDGLFQVESSQGSFTSRSLVISTGGLSIPKVGATGFGYEIAEKFGLKLTPRAPALDGFTLASNDPLTDLSGISLEVEMSCNGKKFREALLFTHAGLSGPVSLQASLHWNPGDSLTLGFLPGQDLFDWFKKRKSEGDRSIVKNLVGELLPARLAENLCRAAFPSTLPLPQVSERALEEFCKQLNAWKVIPTGTVGYNKAEVTRGGVDTDELSSKTMESKKVPGLYFIGEVVDVTGWLGGYNFQWAWASGFAAGQSL